MAKECCSVAQKITVAPVGPEGGQSTYPASTKAEATEHLPACITEPRKQKAKDSTVEELEPYQLFDDFEDRKVFIGSELDPASRTAIIEVLKSNSDCFAWSHSDMIGIDSEITTHKLNVNPHYTPVKQRKRPHAGVKRRTIEEETKKLADNGFIREVKYPEWLANVVVVPKKNNKWKMCVDYTDLNKAYPKDSYPLPQIDRLIDSTAGHRLLTFLDAYSGYNQILMDRCDEEKIAFITDQGTFCYKVMPFGLKNAGATYQCLVCRMFKEYIGRSMEVYIDDMLVKSIDTEHLSRPNFWARDGT